MRCGKIFNVNTDRPIMKIATFLVLLSLSYSAFADEVCANAFNYQFHNGWGSNSISLQFFFNASATPNNSTVSLTVNNCVSGTENAELAQLETCKSNGIAMGRRVCIDMVALVQSLGACGWADKPEKLEKICHVETTSI